MNCLFNVQKGFPYSEKLTTKGQSDTGVSDQHRFCAVLGSFVHGISVFVLATVPVSKRFSFHLGKPQQLESLQLFPEPIFYCGKIYVT